MDRVQNISLWQSYAVKKAATCSREDDPDKARKHVRAGFTPPERRRPQDPAAGFNRSFGKNATLYGKGVYFARDASYSTFPPLRADAQGVQTIRWRRRRPVVQGRQGRAHARRARRGPQHLYDCTVDNVKDPPSSSRTTTPSVPRVHDQVLADDAAHRRPPVWKSPAGEVIGDYAGSMAWGVGRFPHRPQGWPAGAPPLPAQSVEGIE